MDVEQSDDFNAYRAMCANRLRRLERYTKARSICDIREEQPSTAHLMQPMRHSEIPQSAPCTMTDNSSPKYFGHSFDKENVHYEQIREKMFALMENDMSLLQQLLSLGDQISEMKERGLRRTQSTNSIDDRNEQDELADQFEEGFSASMSAVTTLYVDDTRPQYFSRKNSVLRIPIPPRSSNRFGGSNKLPRRPSDAFRQNRNLHVNADDSASECSESAVSPLSNTPSFVSSKSSVTYSSSGASDVGKILKNRSSNSSIDSGIRESSSSSASPSPTFEREVV